MPKWALAEDITNVLIDPRITGAGGFPEIVSEEQWIEANITLVDEMGPRKYLETLLAVLNQKSENVKVADE